MKKPKYRRTWTIYALGLLIMMSACAKPLNTPRKNTYRTKMSRKYQQKEGIGKTPKKGLFKKIFGKKN